MSNSEIASNIKDIRKEKLKGYAMAY